MKYKVIRKGSTCKLVKQANGVYAIYYSRRNTQSLRTRDKVLAVRLFETQDRQRRDKGLVMLDKVKRIRLREFMDEYLAMRSGLVEVDELAVSTCRMDRIALNSLLKCVGDIPLRKAGSLVEAYKLKMLAGARNLEKRKVTVNTYLRHISSAFSWAACGDRATGRTAYIESNPFAETRTEKVKFRGIQRLPRYVSMDDINALRRAMADELREKRSALQTARGNVLKGLERSLASMVEFSMLFEIYLYTGMRLAELVRLNWRDVNIGERLIHIRESKARKERMVAMPMGLVDVLVAYGVQDIGPVCHYSSGYISHLFKDMARKAALDESVHLHGLRHSYGTYAAHAGVPLDVIQRNMGHSSMRTTEIYKDVLVRRQQKEVRDLEF